MELEGRVALVTGASGDIGRAIAVALAAAGCDIAVGYAGNADGAKAACELVEAHGRRAMPVQVDQADPASVETAVAEAARMGRLDILVNNAAWNIGIPFPDLDSLTVDIWDRIYDTNARGPFLLSRAAAKQMRAGGKGGRIVNIASVAGLSPGGSSIAYATSKAALIHLTRCLAVALAPDITVNCVAPGLVENTRMALRLPPAVAAAARQRAVLERASSAEDIAAQVVTFCRADSVTGQVLVIDAGIFFH
ncbi:MAG: SDR family NAD(P)-dependent oxidoreductase [Chloroflexi bacterium]|nr:SDR family NAD(P)-dependent oxidoreductase [Chloroflexota bacterium]